MVHLHITLKLAWRTAFHTTGNRWKWGADKALAQRYDGQFVLPATSLKGALREQAERLLRGHGHKVCAASDPGQMCPDPDNLCLACRVFGNPRRPSPLRFQDGILTREKDDRSETDEIETQIRAGVAISRRRRSAVPQRLYFVETTAAGPMQAQAAMEGFFPSRQEAEEAAALVVLAARMLPALGAGRTRGLGWLAAVEAQCTIDGQSLPDATLQAYWNQWLGGGQ